MVKFMLKISADLENLTNLQPEGGCDDPAFSYLFKLKCGNCGEMRRKEACLSLDYAVRHPWAKGTTNLIQRCKFCSRYGTVTMIPGRGKPLTLRKSEAWEYAPLMLFDCNGYEPVDYVFGNGWQVDYLGLGWTEGGIDLSGGDFGYGMGERPVIYNLRSTFDAVW